MGIHNLKKLISTHSHINEHPLSFYKGKRIAIDASACLYQFLVAIRSDGVNLGIEGTSSHIVGFFYRTIKYIENDIKLVYVFDGKPPEMKDFELSKRLERREDAEILYEQASLEGDKIKMEKYAKRKIKVSKKHVEDVKKLLSLMRVPFIDAPSEGEAFCAALCKNNYVDCVISEDMDSLTFGTPILLTNMNTSDSKKLVKEFSLKRILKDLDLSLDQFIDMCILMGCDYCESPKGIGPQKGLQLIKKYKNIENIIKNEKINIPDEFYFENTRNIFKTLSDVEISPIRLEIDWDSIDDKGIVKFLVNEHSFNEDRVLRGIERLKKCRKKTGQTTINMWFKKK
ncbi:Flap endonuclease 1 [Dictyocoela muelleri]|nr:Flap endonuclease 1 [Dictyocoela muelleri]